MKSKIIAKLTESQDREVSTGRKFDLSISEVLNYFLYSLHVFWVLPVERYIPLPELL